MTTAPDETPLGLVAGLAWLGLLHGAWIGGVAPALVALAFRSRRVASPRARHAILVAALVLVTAGPPTLAGLQHLAGPGPSGAGRAGGASVVLLGGIREVDPGSRPPVPGGPRRGWIPSPSRCREALDSGLGRAVAVARASRGVGLMAWSGSVLGGMAVLGLGLVGVRRLVREAAPAPAGVVERADRLARRLGLRVVPAVRFHPTLGEPCLCGAVRPVILLPGRWLASAGPEAVEAVLAHELAHARRLDPLANGLQRVLEAGTWFHPGVRWLSGMLRRQRELLADSLAVRLTGDPLALARALESAARLRLRPGPRPRHPLGTSLGGEKDSLLPRIQELLGMTPPRPRPQAWPLAALPAAALLALVAVSHGSARDEPPAPPIPPRAEVGPPKLAAPGPLIPAPRAARVGPEERQVSLEIQFLDVEPGTWRLGLDRGRLENLGPESGVSRWMMDGPATFEVVKKLMAVTTNKRILAPKVTIFEAARATISRSPEPFGEAMPDDGGEIRVDVSPTFVPGGTRLAIDLAGSMPAPAPGRVRYRGSSDVPEGSTLALSLGLQGRFDAKRKAPTERVVFITPRRIVLESEEVRIGARPLAEPPPGLLKPR